MQKADTPLMTNTISQLEPFGIATISGDLAAARKFYGALYAYPMVDGEFGGIPYFSLLKGPNTMVTVFEKSAGNPIQGTIPVLKVDSVPQTLERLQSLGVRAVINASICPSTQTNFALCADPEGNQFIIKEAAAG
jgi:predicted enzyme related to lactoylglutathione lyase